jgi:hypothetical protein
MEDSLREVAKMWRFWWEAKETARADPMPWLLQPVIRMYLVISKAECNMILKDRIDGEVFLARTKTVRESFYTRKLIVYT